MLWTHPEPTEFRSRASDALAIQLPSSSQDYWKIIYGNPCFMGGFVWEWADHGIRVAGKEVQDVSYAYGGDFKEAVHDGNFCIDGMVGPNREIKPAALEVKNVYRPISIQEVDIKNGLFMFYNTMDFLEMSPALDCSYIVEDFGKEVLRGEVRESLLPGEKKLVVLPELKTIEGDSLYIRFELRYKSGSCNYETGELAGMEQFCVYRRKRFAIGHGSGSLNTDLRVREEARTITVERDGFKYTLNRRTGLPSAIEYRGIQLLKGGNAF